MKTVIWFFNRAMAVMPLEIIAGLVAFFLFAHEQVTQGDPVALFAILTMLVCWVIGGFRLTFRSDRLEDLESNFQVSEMLPADFDHVDCKVDPWRYQADLMAASGQDMPLIPMLTKGTVTYTALMMGELGETMRGLAKALPSYDRFEILRHRLQAAGTVLMVESEILRTDLSQIPETHFPAQVMPMAKAKELLDGFTDLMVVTSGASLATGLPGRMGYLVVQTSNLTKKNPDTGVIDKDASGKWIKPPTYIPPHLEEVLGQFYQ